MASRRDQLIRRSRPMTTLAWAVGVLAIAGMLLVAAVTASRDDDSRRATPAATTPTQSASQPQRVAIVGDSNTVLFSSDFSAGVIDPTSWVTQLFEGDDFAFAGGWAVAGSTSVMQADGFAPVDSDVLVMLSGTNDVFTGVPFAETAPSLQRIAETSGAERIVVLAIPPIAYETAQTVGQFNAQLAELAETNGWEYFDGFAFLRDRNGGWAEGTTIDGLHFTAEAHERFGRNVARYLRG